MSAKLLLLTAYVLLFAAANPYVAPDVLWSQTGSLGQILDTFDYRDGNLVLTFLPDARRPDPATVFLRLPDGGAIPARVCDTALCFPAADLEPPNLTPDMAGVLRERFRRNAENPPVSPQCVEEARTNPDLNCVSPIWKNAVFVSGPIAVGSEIWISEARWVLHDSWLDVGGTSHRLPSFALGK